MKQLLCYGDSNTWGLIPGTVERFPWGVRWTSILQEKLREYGINVINEDLKNLEGKFDVIILGVAHDCFKNIQVNDLLKREYGVVYDVKGVLDRNIVDGRL